MLDGWMDGWLVNGSTRTLGYAYTHPDKTASSKKTIRGSSGVGELIYENAWRRSVVKRMSHLVLIHLSTTHHDTLRHNRIISHTIQDVNDDAASSIYVTCCVLCCSKRPAAATWSYHNVCSNIRPVGQRITVTIKKKVNKETSTYRNLRIPFLCSARLLYSFRTTQRWCNNCSAKKSPTRKATL